MYANRCRVVWNIVGSMPANILIRPVKPNENGTINRLAQTIADETFAYLFKGQVPVPVGESNWASALLAVSAAEIVAVTMTREEWVSDLWVRKDVRRMGVGTRLLAEAEREICSRGHETFRLNVVKTNIRAVHFYESQGWQVRREFAHKKFGHAMFELTKSDGAVPRL
jgi:ribosomal protein S18 acetylase RimI-like enzyme